ncbi:MAG: hypothetical protein LUE12_03635 [Ruminococcus sp.]|nr:hypothetical protein [Ruminococcus sp.]
MRKNLLKKILSVVLSASMLICLAAPNMAVTALSADTDWYNTTDTSFTITTAAELAGLASLVNDGNDFSGKTITLGSNIDLNSEAWTPIGTYSSYPFNGTFDGQGYTVANLFINDTISDYLGLFGYVGSSGTVQNITVNGTVTGSSDYSTYVGGVVGVNAGTVSYCDSSVTVYGIYYVGGVVSYNSGTVMGCSNSGTVSAEARCGGVVGYASSGEVSGCTNSGVVSGTIVIGGVVGYAYKGEISGCTNSGDVTGDGYFVGGVAGCANGSTVSDCCNSGDVICNGGYAGGVVGNSYNNTVTSCYSVGKVSGSDGAGGVIGYVESVTISNTYYLDSAADSGVGSDSSISGTTATTIDEFESGEVAYLLNGSVSGGTTWYQNLDNGETVDSYPVLDSTHGTVYLGTCAGTVIYSNSEVSAAEHSYEAVVTDPTCTENGYTTYTCSVCGDSYTADETEALGHTTEIQNAKDATCTEDGYTGDEVCTVCGETVATGEAIAATGHSYSEIKWTWADDYSTATAVLTCESCGESEEITADATSVTTEATETEDGSIVYTVMVELDGQLYSDSVTVTIAATGSDDSQSDSTSDSEEDTSSDEESSEDSSESDSSSTESTSTADDSSSDSDSETEATASTDSSPNTGDGANVLLIALALAGGVLASAKKSKSKKLD